jgi:cell division inhibitor SepF
VFESISENGMVRMVRSFFSFENEEGETGGFSRPAQPHRKVVPISDKLNSAAITVKSPRSRDDAIDAADRLKEGGVCIVNLSKLEKELAKEILYFLSGTIYALGGDSKKIGTDIFLFSPQCIAITQLDDLQEKAAGQSSLGFGEL